jgi:dCTP deaminase
MSILSDSEIRALCQCPDTKMITPQNPNAITKLPGGGSVSTLLHFDSTPYEVPLTNEERDAFRPMITPFVNGQVREGQGSITKPMAIAVGGRPFRATIPNGPKWKLLSYGLDSHGYDIRLSEDVKLYSNIASLVIDPKEFDEHCLVQAKILEGRHGCKFVIIPPNSCALGVTVESFDMPVDVSGLVVGKNSYARCSVIVNPTKIQPGYKGKLTLEFSNSSNLPARLYIDEGAASCSFFRSNEVPERAYLNNWERSAVVLPTLPAVEFDP